MTGRLYTVEFSAQDQTNGDGNMDMFELRPSSSAGVTIALMGLYIANTSEVGDAQEEMIHYSIIRMTGATFTSGTGGTTPTPQTADFEDGAADFAADAVNDVVATTSGTSANLHQDGFNVRTGLKEWWPDGARFKVPGVANAALLVRFNTTVADTITWQGTAWVLEGS